MGARRRLVAALGAVAFAVVALAACGEDDFENEPRPPAPVERSVRISDREVVVSPDQVGAGIVNFTISNQSDDPATFTLVGPTDATSSEIPPGGVGSLKAALEEGSYEAGAGDSSKAREGTLEVGPERPTSQNELLLP
jgi:hypothetical protein